MPSRLDYHAAVFRFRHSPVAVAMTAGAIGLLCGALFVGVFARPSGHADVTARSQPVETSGASTQAKLEASPVEKQTPPAKTDTAGDKTKPAESAECERQAWPYIAPQCLAERETGQRKVRVIAVDKLARPVLGAIETRNPPRAKAEQKAETPAAPAQSKSEASSAATPPPNSILEAPPTVAPAVAATSVGLPEAAPASRPEHAASRGERRKSARDRRNREARTRVAPARVDDEEEVVVDDARTPVAAREDGRGGRTMERRIEREYEARSHDGSQRRRVIVIRRYGDRGHPYMPSASNYSRSTFQY